jgi:hypothetical protein
MKPTHLADEDRETLEAAAIFGQAAHYFATAADMLSKGAPFRDPKVQHLISAGRVKLAELPDRRH